MPALRYLLHLMAGEIRLNVMQLMNEDAEFESRSMWLKSL